MGIEVPPPVPGDPAGMRALAAQLRAVADAVGGDTAGAIAVVGAMDFKGPAATRLRGVLADAASRTAGDLDGLNAAADLLLRSAAEVEHAQNERARLMRLAAEQTPHGAAGP